jgi:hypothetical protein
MVANPQRAELGPWIDAVLREIDAKLRSMPEKVTSTQARADHNDLAHRGVLTCSGFVHLPGARHEQA